MDKTLQKFASREDADRADRDYYRSLSPEQRMEILFELIAQETGEPTEGFPRVYRLRKLGEC